MRNDNIYREGRPDPEVSRQRRRHHHVDGHHPDEHHPDEHHLDKPSRAGVDDVRHRGRRRGRAPRGDVRSAVLVLLTEEPMHGYQLMQAIADRTGGRWRPSPGAIYPTISQLEDERLITVTSNAGRKLAALTDAGREHVAANSTSWPDPFASFAQPDGFVDLRGELEKLHGAARQVARAGTAAQQAEAQRIVIGARRALYRLLAEDTENGE